MRHERGFTLVEIMIVVAIIALLAAIAIPNILRGRSTANEAAAIGNVRAIISGQEMFRSVNNVYPGSATWVADMFPPPPQPGFAPQPFTGGLGAPVQGYNYTYTATPALCATAGPTFCTGYDIDGTAANFGQTGVRSFVGDQSGQVRHCIPAAAGAKADSTNDVGPDATIDAPATNPCDP